MEDDTDFEEQLIEQVRRYSHLYVPYLTEYKDLTVTNNSWKEIAQTLGVEKHICRTKWKSLRDRYVRLRRKMKGGSGRPASGIKPQILTTLSWLSDFIKHKDNESNHLQAEDVDNSEDLEDDISSGSVQETGRPAVRRNVISERTRFNQRQQEAGETVDSFITALHSLSEHCGYGTMVREMIRDRLVAGLCDRALSEQLQLDPELTLDKAIACIYQSERVKKQQGLPEQTDTTNASASHVIGELSCCQQASQESVEELLDVDGAYKCVENSNPGGGKPHQCAYCGSGFQRVRDLKRHQQTHTGEKPHQCPLCSKRFARLDKLKLHQEIHTGVKPHSCPDCEKCFVRLDKLQLHQRTHTGVKCHRCPDCDRSFSRLDNLNSHKKVHEKEAVNVHPTENLKDIVQSVRLDQLETTYNAISSEANADSEQTQQKTSSEVGEGRTYESRVRSTPPHEEETQDTDDSDEWTPSSRTGGEKPHYCSDCDRRFRKVRDLVRHQRTHTGEKPHHCPVCNRGFARLDKLKLHQEVHTGVKPHSCPDCEKSFARLDNLKLHRKIHMKTELHVTNTYQTELNADCTQTSPRNVGRGRGRGRCRGRGRGRGRPRTKMVDKAPEEMAQSQLGNSSQCRSSDNPLQSQSTHDTEGPESTSEDWTQYFSSMEKKPYLCPDCGKSFRLENRLRRHQRTHTGEKPYDCPDCDKRFARLDHVSAHQKTHRKQERNFSCSDCAKSFVRLEQLERHQLTHTKSYGCSKCDQRFSDLVDWKAHFFIHREVLRCPDCDKQFLYKGLFERHRRTHSKKRQKYLCTLCGKECSNLKIHMRVHTGEKPYHCAECGKSFPYSKSYKTHILTHDRERETYPCLECGKTYTRVDGMVRHVRRVHARERNHQCLDCGKRFFRKETMQRHKRVHTGERPYQCAVCGQRFSQDGDRKRHEKRHYSGVSDFLDL